ncbi:CBM20 domain-containing protein [Meloidogyne graminicola]|uniref:CBM20 domain-containing protein n=1 Tax=Meloidogyne graminicola TaxID=189291 RepID=A0A8S9ZU48_9BILA|nr:CBM20 domain-containing protein [Meloidogyne graminicola]
MSTVNFSVFVPFHILGGQRVFLTGSSKELGSWDARKALKLKKDKDGFWIGSTQISNDPVIMYFYFIGHSIKTETADEKILSVLRWEELVKPRCLTFSDVCGLANLRDVFGEEKSTNGNFSNEQLALKLTGDLKLFKKRKKNSLDGTEVLVIKTNV